MTMVFIPLPLSFYEQSAEIVAQKILGHTLVRITPSGELLTAKIIETEAYKGKFDPASHASHGITKRNKTLFGKAGHAYIYAMHQSFCLNITTDKKEIPGSILIRSALPVDGIAVMKRYRNNFTLSTKKLADGPGKLCEALNIDLSLNGIDMTSSQSPLFISNKHKETFKIVVLNRFGITQAIDLPLRFKIQYK